MVNAFEIPLLDLTWKKLLVNNEFVRFDDFDLFSGFPLDNRRYPILKNSFLNLKKRFGGGDEEPMDIQVFFMRLTNGSKSF